MLDALTSVDQWRVESRLEPAGCAAHDQHRPVLHVDGAGAVDLRREGLPGMVPRVRQPAFPQVLRTPPVLASPMHLPEGGPPGVPLQRQHGLPAAILLPAIQAYISGQFQALDESKKRV